MLPDTNIALPWPLFSRSRVSISIRMSATIFSSRDLADSTFCIVPQRCLSCALAGSVKPFVFGLEPLVDLLLRRDVLVDVPRLVAQIQHDLVLHRLVELVGVDVAAEDLDALLLVRFSAAACR